MPESGRPVRASSLAQVHMAAVLFCATFLAYLPCLEGGPIMDDAVHLTKPELQSFRGLVRIWSEVGVTPQYYPVLHSAFWGEHRLWGGDLLGYHLTNLLLHTISALLVVAIARRLSLPGAWLAGFLFALHPVCVNSVAWIAEQKNTLSTVFYLSAALVYLNFHETRRRRQYAAALALFLLALASKSVTATLPAALLVILWWRYGRLEWRRDVRPLAPWLAIGSAAGLFTAWVERRYVGADIPALAMPVLERVLLAGRVVWFYLEKLIWPANLAFIYPRWHVDASEWWQYLFPIALCMAAAGLCLLARRTRGPLAAFLFFVFTLFPVLGFLNVYPFLYSYVSDHFQYLASLGVIVPGAAGLSMAARRIFLSGSRAPVLAAAALVAALGVATWRTCGVYRGPEALYTDTLARNPDCWLAHNNLGNYLMPISGREGEAVRHFEAALRLNPDLPETHDNLGTALARMPGRMSEAIAHFRAALRIRPDFAAAHMNLGNALSQMPNGAAEAIPQFQAVSRMAPRYPEAHYNLGIALAQVGRSHEAIGEFEAALQLDPESADAHASLGNLLASEGRMTDAVAHLEAALRIRPDFAEAHYFLGVALAKMPGRMPEALSHLEASLRLKPDAELRQLVDELRAAR